jgi:hypothetical protein
MLWFLALHTNKLLWGPFIVFSAPHNRIAAIPPFLGASLSRSNELIISTLLRSLSHALIDYSNLHFPPLETRRAFSRFLISMTILIARREH